MYERFFALDKAPFSLALDPHSIHLTYQQSEAVHTLAFGIRERKGYLVLTGEAGMGKTTALRSLSNLLAESNVISSTICLPTLTAGEFLELAMLNFGFRNIPSSKAMRLKLLEQFLFDCDREDRILALIVDEAHQLNAEALEEIRLLGNFETDRKLLQIVLAGQNQLNDKLNLPELWQLKQRVTIRAGLKPLERDAVDELIRYRWAMAGGEEPTPFSAAAVDAIAAWSKGVPRLINAICDNALVIAFSESIRTVGAETIREACAELSLDTPPLAEHKPESITQRPDPVAIAPAEGNAATNEGTPRPSLLQRLFSPVRRPFRSKSGILRLGEP